MIDGYQINVVFPAKLVLTSKATNFYPPSKINVPIYYREYTRMRIFTTTISIKV
jgi:hypothetical protein